MDIVASTPNDGSYVWTIPDTLGDDTQYVIRISDAIDPTIYDDNDAFSITTPSGPSGII